MEWQLSVLQFIQGFRNTVLDGVFTVITMSGEEYFFVLAAAILLWCWHKEAGYRVGFSLLSATVLNPILKNSFRIDRPIGAEGLVAQRVETAPGYAFPSGHTMGSAAFWTASAFQVRRRWFTGISVAMMVLVALSRMYLGVHWPSDVIGGLVFGLAWVWAVGLVYDWSERTGRSWVLWLVLGAALPFWLVFRDPVISQSLGAVAGFLAGRDLERAKIRQAVRGAWWQHGLKVVLGLGITLGIQVGMKPLLPGAPWLVDTLRYALVGFWLSAGAPWLFVVLRLSARRAPAPGPAR